MMFNVDQKFFIKPHFQDDTVGIEQYYLVKEIDSFNGRYNLLTIKYRTDKPILPSINNWFEEFAITDALNKGLIYLDESEIIKQIIERHKKKILDEEKILEAWKIRVNKRIDKLQNKLESLFSFFTI